MTSNGNYRDAPSANSSAASAASSNASSDGKSRESHDERRKQIREIMKDPVLSQTDKNRAVQSLMDGRRRSSIGTRSICSNESGVSAEDNASNYVTRMAAAAASAADYYSSDDEGDTVMSEAPEDIYDYGYNTTTRLDDRSVASSVTHSSHISAAQHPKPGQYRQVHGRSYSLQDWTDNDRVVAAAQTSFPDNPAQISRLMEQSRPNCEHYARNCTLISPCCGLAFGCRICHDECPVLPPLLSLRNHNCAADDMLGNSVGQVKKGAHQKLERRRSMPTDFLEDEETHHAIDRFAVREVLCRGCYTRQSSKTNNCINCQIVFGEYHCNVCNLWMSSKEAPYHCEDCGFCRVGGRENFKHCHDCGMCIDTLLFDDHNCKHGKYMSNCPVCQEDLFSSRYASHEMPCGHAIHWHCFKELTSYDTRCPVCKKTAETPDQMASTWSAIDMGIALQPVPPDMARCVNIICNDCEVHDANRRWHFLGVRCMSCMSFNTSVERIVKHGRDAAVFLDQLEQRRAGAGGVPVNISMLSIAQNDGEGGSGGGGGGAAMDEDPPDHHDTGSL